MATRRGSSMVKEVGTALAVAAIYILTLLLPLHQAAGLQRDLSKLGYATIAGSICNPAQPDSPYGRADAVVKCSAASIAKTPFADTAPAPHVEQVGATVTLKLRDQIIVPPPGGLGLRDGWSRAPPPIG